MSDADPPKPVDVSKLVHVDFVAVADEDPNEHTTSEVLSKSPLFFPAFVYGEYAICRRQMKAEVKRWIKQYDVAIRSWGFSIALVTQRFEAVLSFWEPLDTLRYLDIHFRKLSLSELMLSLYEGTIRMWVDAPQGSVPEILHTTIQQMRKASEDEAYARIIRRLYEIIDTDPTLQRREWLRSPGFLEAKLSHMRENNPDWYGYMETGIGFPEWLAERERKYPLG